LPEISNREHQDYIATDRKDGTVCPAPSNAKVKIANSEGKVGILSRDKTSLGVLR
jgi:hypothetical protein